MDQCRGGERVFVRVFCWLSAKYGRQSGRCRDVVAQKDDDLLIWLSQRRRRRRRQCRSVSFLVIIAHSANVGIPGVQQSGGAEDEPALLEVSFKTDLNA